MQAAARLILEAIFEADFLDASYGYRPGRNAHEALAAIERNVQEGYAEIYDADLQAYFDTIPHDKLLKCVERRVADRSVLRLLRLWLNAPVEERDEHGRPKRSRPTPARTRTRTRTTATTASPNPKLAAANRNKTLELPDLERFWRERRKRPRPCSSCGS